MGSIRAALLDAVVAALPVALVYFAGWAYLSSYLDAFAIDPTQVSVPLTTVLVYAFKPLSDWRFLVGAGMILTIWQTMSLIPRCRKFQARTSLTFSIVSIVLLLFGIRYVAVDHALQMAALVWKGEKSISVPEIEKVTSTDVGYTQYEQCKSNDRFRQIIGFPEQIFVLCVNKQWPDNAVLFQVKADGKIGYYAARQKAND